MKNTKEVYFDEYCDACKHSDKKGSEEPCTTCLTYGYNFNTHKPMEYVEDKKKK